MKGRGQIKLNEHTGGYFVNIDIAGNVIHKDSCPETVKMDPLKNEGEIFHSEDYEEAESYLNDNNIKFKTCDKCRPP